MIEDLTDKVFGALTVLGVDHKHRQHTYWKCRCVCGEEMAKRGDHLRSGRTKTCGCQQSRQYTNHKPKKDLTGIMFGEVEALSYSHSIIGAIYWNVRCSCGKEYKTSSETLKGVVSCGCKNRHNLTGKRFNNFKVIRCVGSDGNNNIWECLCDCGNTFFSYATTIANKKTKRCPSCRDELKRRSNTTHGMSTTRLSDIYFLMKSRCYNKNIGNYKNYGGRGIYMCDEWKNNISSFLVWAITSGYSDNLSIDRINNDGPYSPDNCRWATSKEQGNNKRTNVKIEYEDKTKTPPEWGEALGIHPDLIRARYNQGYSIDKVFCPFDLRTGKPLNRPYNK